jgi:hypothetical protein
MCRLSCCSKSSGEGAAITAIAVVIGGALIVAKIGPILARIFHVVIEALAIMALTAASVLACLVVIWLAIRIIRWRNRHRTVQRPVIQPVRSAARLNQQTSGQRCLACGDTRRVLRAIGSRYQDRPCPTCEPAHRAG